MNNEKKTQRRFNLTIENWLFILNNRVNKESVSDFLNRLISMFRKMKGE